MVLWYCDVGSSMYVKVTDELVATVVTNAVEGV